MSVAAAPVRLSVRDLSFSYADRHVFNGWSADFGPGMTWLRGSNGSGKSTLLKLLGGALLPLAGHLTVDGVDSLREPLTYRREVFWCGPGSIAFDHLRAQEYFRFLRGFYKRFDAVAAQTHVDGLGLRPYVGDRLSDLSTGTQRKVWLAAALVVGTAVVLVDEPLNALDRASLTYLRQQLGARAAGAQAWVIASHEPPLIAVAPSQVLHLDPQPP